MGLKGVTPPLTPVVARNEAVAVPVKAAETSAPASQPPTPQPMEKPEFSTPARQDPATQKAMSATANVQSSTQKRHLWHAKDVNAQVSQLRSENKFSTLAEIDESIGAIPDMLAQRMKFTFQGLMARINLGPDLSQYEPSDKAVDPTNYYYVGRHIAAMARESNFGNCGDKAMIAAAMMTDRGLYPVEVFMLDHRDGDHGFCVVGRALLSDPTDPSTWGPDAVIVDPWSNEAYPVSELLADPHAKMRGLLPTGIPPRFERFALVAGADPNPKADH